jgi:hypothetical protein
MSQQGNIDKLTENVNKTISNSITTLFKKSQLYDKAYNIKYTLGIYLLIPFTGTIIFGYLGYIKLMYQNKQIKNELKELNDLNCESSNKVNDNIEILNNKIDFLEKELKEQLEKQTTLLTTIRELHLLNISRENHYSERSPNMSIFMEDSTSKPVIYSKQENIANIANIENFDIEPMKKNNTENDEDIELLSECYDSIPLNNSKKITGIKNFIWFNKN